jgi:outer membrane protein assembly factor BamB
LLARYDKDKDSRLSKQESGSIVVMRRPELSDNTPGAHVTAGGVFAYIDLDKDGYMDAQEWEAAMSMVAGMIKPHGLLAVKPGGEGDITASHVAWKESRNLPEVPSPVLYRDRVYMVANGGIVSCMEAKDGRVVFRGRLGAPGEYYASPVAAGGRLYFASHSGVVTVLEAGEELQILSRNDLKQDIFASPAVVGDTLYIRTADRLYAFRAPGAKI